MQMPKVHGTDTVVDQALKSETHDQRKEVPMLILVILKFMLQPQRIAPPALHTKGHGRAGNRRKIIRPKLQPIPQSQPSPAP